MVKIMKIIVAVLGFTFFASSFASASHADTTKVVSVSSNPIYQGAR